MLTALLRGGFLLLMLSLEKCKEILGETGKSLTDAQIAELRDLLYLFAKVFISDFKQKQGEANAGL